MKIIEQQLNEEISKELSTKLLSNTFSWYLNVQSSAGPCFTHQFFYQGKPSFDAPILEKLVETMEMKIPTHIIGKLFYNTGIATEHEIKSEQKHPASTAIYFLNTCNGYIVLDDGVEIPAIENNMLFFDGTRDYKIVQCTDEKVFSFITFNYF